MRVNLLTETKRDFSINWLEICIITIVILIVVLLGWQYYSNQNKINLLKQEITNLDSQLNIAMAKKNEYLELQSKITELEKKKQELAALTYYWDQAVKEMGYVIPDQAVLKFMQLNDNLLSASGLAVDTREVLKLVNNMKKSPVYDDIKLIKIEDQGEINFQLEARLVGEGD